MANLPVTTSDNLSWLGFYNPGTNTIEVADPNRIQFKILPYQTTIKRLYLISQGLQDDSSVTVNIAIDGAQKYTYEAKVLVGRENSTIEHFKQASHSDTVIYLQTEKRFDNGLPIDIYLKSKSKTESFVLIDISIEFDEQIAL